MLVKDLVFELLKHDKDSEVLIQPETKDEHSGLVLGCDEFIPIKEVK